MTLFSNACTIKRAPDFSGVTRLALHPAPALADYLAAMRLAREQAESRLEFPMLLSWYDRDRDFEAPQHVSECHHDPAVPGYVEYGLSHGACLLIDIEGGRFVFIYRDAGL